MNREILFRGKVTDNSGCEIIEVGEFIYGDLIHYANGETFIRQQETGMELPVNPNTVGQYTGLKDINDAKIFEGDIINTCNDRGVIEFDCGVFGINWDYGRCDNRTTMFGTFGQRHNLRRMDDEIIDRIERIGNIYDNPGLLKKK